MIPSNREIQIALDEGRIVLKPRPVELTRWSATTIDLTLDSELRPWKPILSRGENVVVNPLEPTFNSKRFVEENTTPVDCTNGFVIEPHQLVLGWTVETLKLPHTARIGARVEGKSSLARLGLGIHVTAPTVHPGFGVNPLDPAYQGSPIRLEIWNAGPLHIRLTRGMAICQIIFEEVHGTPEEGYIGQFAVQGPSPVPEARKKRRGAGGR